MRLLHFTGQTAMMKMKEDTVNKSFLLSPKERKLDTDLGLHSCDSDSKTSTEKESNPDAIYLIPMDFVMQWKKFIKNPTAENMPISLSSGLGADGVLCEHDKMLKTWQMLIDESTLCPLSSYEWDVLSHAYPHRPQENDEPLDLSDLETKITTYPTMYLLPQHDSESSWRLEPSVYNTLCLECHSQLITINQTYNNARIRIRLVSGLDEAVSSSVQSASVNSSVTDPMMSLDSAATTNTCSQSEFINTNPDNPDQKMDNLNKIRCYFNERSTIEQSRAEKGAKPLTSFNATKVPTSPDHNREENMHHILCDNTNIQSSNHLESSSVNYVRRSTRQRLNPKDLLIKANSSDTLLNMKVQIMQILGIMPSDQHIMSCGVELVDNTKTLLDLGICSKSILYLWTDDPTWDPSRTSFDNGTLRLTTLKSKSGSPCKSATEPIQAEPGFKGTRLLEY
ncbi:unnamed protein product [Heterobilharzia americana]|nr:unnamed protein product [Heterobilharzia americana]